MAVPSSILVWRIPWKEEPGRLQSIVLQRTIRTEVTLHAHMHGIKEDFVNMIKDFEMRSLSWVTWVGLI